MFLGWDHEDISVLIFFVALKLFRQSRVRQAFAWSERITFNRFDVNQSDVWLWFSSDENVGRLSCSTFGAGKALR